MKKLLLLIVLCMFFISCKKDSPFEETPSIPRSEWDSENIAYTNTDTIKNNEYSRQSGTTGIVGTFESKRIEHGLVTETIIYNFKETGYFEYSDIGTNGTSYFNNKDSGTFKIEKSDYDDYFIIRTYSTEEHGNNKFFYQVSNTHLNLSPYVIINGISVAPSW